MLVLFESSAGYVLFKADDGKLKQAGEEIHAGFEADAGEMVKFQAMAPFKDTTEAVVAATALVESKLDKGLRVSSRRLETANHPHDRADKTHAVLHRVHRKKFLKKHIASKNLGETLAVSDAKLGGLIKDKLNIQCVNDKSALEVIRGIRANFMELVPGLGEEQMRGTALGLSHSLSRYKLKFSPDKVDTMVVQAINLLDELDKEVNTYAMRVREWYGWHFPEMAKILSDNMQYARIVLKVGLRVGMAATDLSDIIEEDKEQELKTTAEVSMGTEISEDDIENIQALCEQVIAMSEYRAQLFDYLKNRMAAIAPNLTIMVGELVGARLIAHAGSLMNLAKSPASTVQILGAEKALFRALKTKHDTPKYGLIYHASLIGQAAPKNKGKISRVLAAKCALSIRVDALGDADGATIGYECREKVEARLRQLETGQPYQLISGSAAANGQPKKYDRVAAVTGGTAYNASADNVASGDKKRKRDDEDDEEDDEAAAAKRKAEKKARKAAKAAKRKAAAEAMDDGDDDEPKKKKKKKKDKKKKDKKS